MYFFYIYVINIFITRYKDELSCISAQYQRHTIQNKTIFIFRNYFIGIHIFTLVSPLDDEESHIFILNSQGLDCLLRIILASRSYGLIYASRSKIFVVKNQLQVGMYDLLTDNCHIQ